MVIVGIVGVMMIRILFQPYILAAFFDLSHQGSEDPYLITTRWGGVLIPYLTSVAVGRALVTNG